MNMASDMPLSDAHAHLNSDDALDELAQRCERGILTCFSTGTPEEWERANGLLTKIADSETAGAFLVSFGIHPWEAANHEPRTCDEAYARCAAVGEIGLDTVWCDVPLARQSTVFEEQLQRAADLHKPIVLHTKGTEERIADMMRGFPEPICVHWYSGPLEAFERFAEMGCYFTLGPDCSNGSVLSEAMMTALPLNRILTETDGLEGVRWAIEQDPLLTRSIGRFLDPNASLIEAALANSTYALASARDVPSREIALLLRQNMQRFYLNEQIEHGTATITADGQAAG